MENANTYITLLLQDNEQLKNSLAGYLNNILSIRHDHRNLTNQSETPEQFELRLKNDITPEEVRSAINQISLFRGYATRIFISINSLKTHSDVSIKGQVIQEIKQDYQIIKTNPMPSYDTCERFAQNINNILEEQVDVQALMNMNAKGQQLASLQ